MKVIGLMAWYEELPNWLAATVASASKICDHIIAVDGAYGLYPDGRHRSGAMQEMVIHDTAVSSEMGVTIHVPQEKWVGNEIEKRATMFRLAETITTPGEDWYFVIDADEIVREVPNSARQQLEDTDLDVAEVTLVNHEDVAAKPEKFHQAQKFAWNPETHQTLRMFFRAIPGLAPYGNHYTYMTPDGRTLWGNPAVCEQEPALDMSEMVVDHIAEFRPKHRDEQRRRYYGAREQAGVEDNLCFKCGKPGATKGADANWRRSAEGFITAQRVPVCEDCEVWAKEESNRQARALGADPDTWIRSGTVEVPK